MEEKALNYYLGKNESPKYNCAQSVLACFTDDIQLIEKFAEYGKGKAPENTCGAIYAAMQLCKDKKTIEDYFTNLAGSIKCQDIRASKKISCLDCVRLAARMSKESLRTQ